MEFGTSKDAEDGSAGPRQGTTGVSSDTLRDQAGATGDIERTSGIEQVRKQLEAFAS